MRYKAKTENLLFYDPNLTHKRETEGKFEKFCYFNFY